MLRLREPGGRGTVKVLLQTPDYVEQKPLTPHDDGLDLWQAIPGVTEMSVAKQQHSYQCDQCGGPNIVALQVLYEQGTRKYSSPTNWGSSQSYSAQGAAPPRRKGYGGPFLLWGFLLSFFLFWSWACYSAMLKYPKTASSMEYPLGLLGLMVLGCVIGLVLTSRKVSRYNQAVFPVLYSTWARTYMCRRCGKLFHIPS
jgi:hypothetical protein